MEELIEFGKIVNTHGLKGEVKVYSYTDNPVNILNLKTIYIDNIVYIIESIRFAKNMFIIKFKSINSIEDTKNLINKECYRKVTLGESNSDEGFFIKDLVGLDVFDISGNKLGKLKEVFQTGANDVYEIIDENNKAIYLPAIEKVVKNIDIQNKKMIVEVMEGLI